MPSFSFQAAGRLMRPFVTAACVKSTWSAVSPRATRAPGITLGRSRSKVSHQRSGMPIVLPISSSVDRRGAVVLPEFRREPEAASGEETAQEAEEHPPEITVRMGSDAAGQNAVGPDGRDLDRAGNVAFIAYEEC